MRNHDSKTPEENRAYLLQQALKRQTEAYDAQSDLSPQLDPLEQVTCRIGDTSCARAHASTLNRAAVGWPSRAGQSLLQLQRQYGNRYVQQVLRLARKGDGEAEATPEIEEAIRRARSGGQALDSRVQTQMESAFGADFGGVRVHTDAEANTLNWALNARAFTTDQDIFFRQDQYNPGSPSGQELLAHELTHVVQQTGDRVRRKLTVGQPGDRYEQEADRVAKQVMRMPEPRVQRQVGSEEEGEEALQTKPLAAQITSLVQRQLAHTIQQGDATPNISQLTVDPIFEDIVENLTEVCFDPVALKEFSADEIQELIVVSEEHIIRLSDSGSVTSLQKDTAWDNVRTFREVLRERH